MLGFKVISQTDSTCNIERKVNCQRYSKWIDSFAWLFLCYKFSETL